MNLEKPNSRKLRLRLARALADGRELHIPARKVITKSTARILRELASVKMRCKVPCESAIEFDYYSILDVRRDVVGFYAQPECLHFVDSCGVWHEYFPDVKVVYLDGTVELHEVKPKRKVRDKQLQERHEAISAEYARRCVRFKVVFEREVRGQPQLANAQLLRRYRMRRIRVGILARVRAILAGGGATLAAVEASLGRGVAGRADLLALALHGFVYLDFQSEAIGPASMLHLPAGDRA